MISSWKQVLSTDNIIILLSITFGLTIGYFIQEGAESFNWIEIVGYQIPSFITFGVIAGLTIQTVSVLSSWMATACFGDDLYNRIFCLLIGVPIGMVIAFNIFGGYFVALGFVIPYILNTLLPDWVVMRIFGWNTTYLLLGNAISLLPLYIVSSGIIWFIEYCRSMV
jgi:hypothetical protein